MKSLSENVPFHKMAETADIVSPTCILCGCDSREFLQEQGSWQIYKCLQCGLGVLDPQPRKDFLPKLYEKEYFASQYDTGVEPDSPVFNRWLGLLDHRVRFFSRLK